MTTISIFGGTGYTGGNIAKEAASRGISVISYSRHLPADDSRAPGVDYRTGSIFDAQVVRAAAEASDVVVVALPAREIDGHRLIEAIAGVTSAVAAAGRRLGVVGGAGSLSVSEGGPKVLDTPDFPDAFREEAGNHAKILDLLRTEPNDVDWFYVSPSGEYGSFNPGEHTGTFRLGGDVLLTTEDGRSFISGADFAQAFVDEIEHSTHSRQRFTVGY
ncbi:NAD(P)-dependent oxidoreductase [Pseudoclavibacter sp. 13-3]|uniref:NAD(P)-dependent oxidoreductase n=1 Tax=Pseudoclavibacter sp. 13-3 TaxID=2901228 RepID=UPI001E5DC492|nr:NAD(P)H-binding protein [Pseudoclavibacter sp. 13-3]MCD7101438.1 NAD(P)H-binding protein [Pseudoclavibacter sp. 13-3]